MAENSKIEWCDHTVNLWWGCAKVHTGCKNCYAEALSDERYKKMLWGEKTQRQRVMSAFKDLNKFQKNAQKNKVYAKVFMGSMMDIFEDTKMLSNPCLEFTNTNDLRVRLFNEIENKKYPNLIFLFLTKRPQNILNYIPVSWIENPPKNVWFGTSVSDQETANALIPKLLEVKGNKFLSIEPQVGKVSLKDIQGNAGSVYQVLEPLTNCGDSNRDRIDWVIQGGESGHKKRPFNIEWAYLLKKQCENAKVPYFFKQIDKIKSIPPDLFVREFPDWDFGRDLFN